MIELYVKTGCPFCAKAIAALDKYNVSYEKKNISDEKIVAELKEKGGKRQVPFLDDDNMTPYLVDDDIEMYESDAIVAYVEEKFGAEGGAEPKITVHMSENTTVCPSEPE